MDPAARPLFRTAILGAVLLLGLGPGAATRASWQEPPAGIAPPEPDATPEPPAPEAPESQLSPENQSPYLTRTYKMRPAKLWKGLLEALEAEGFPPEETSQDTRTVKSSFVDFSQEKYPAAVAEPPMRLGRSYHILQMTKVKQGKVSLEGVVSSSRNGTELRVRARILVMGLDRVRRVRMLVDRRSTGVIEADFIHRLEERLGIEHL
ncbi:MAG TPA: hypothetical protein VGV60_10355 [Candidatus Polarisedimenticolia bacterium]|jgi:hypothetical protein|nr:hypothetical protein [Candidatus Polarisedimenticolia bacterium]